MSLFVCFKKHIDVESSHTYTHRDLTTDPDTGSPATYAVTLNEMTQNLVSSAVGTGIVVNLPGNTTKAI